VLVKSTFGGRAGGDGGGGEIKTSANTTVTAEAGSWSPVIELNPGAVMNVDNAGASIIDLILNGGTFNAPTGTMRFTAAWYGGNALQYNSGTFNHNNGTVEFYGRYDYLDIVLQQPLDLYNVNINTPYYFDVANNGNDFNINNILDITSGYFGVDSMVTAKGDVLVENTFGGWNKKIGEINIDNNNSVTIGAGAVTPAFVSSGSIYKAGTFTVNSDSNVYFGSDLNISELDIPAAATLHSDVSGTTRTLIVNTIDGQSNATLDYVAINPAVCGNGILET
jgi:hypothetical protein